MTTEHREQLWCGGFDDAGSEFGLRFAPGCNKNAVCETCNCGFVSQQPFGHIAASGRALFVVEKGCAHITRDFPVPARCRLRAGQEAVGVVFLFGRSEGCEGVVYILLQIHIAEVWFSFYKKFVLGAGYCCHSVGQWRPPESQQ